MSASTRLEQAKEDNLLDREEYHYWLAAILVKVHKARHLKSHGGFGKAHGKVHHGALDCSQSSSAVHSWHLDLWQHIQADQHYGEDYSDADYAGDSDTKQSTAGFVFITNGGAISWSSRPQPTVAVSTTQAEYMASAQAVSEAPWLRKSLGHVTLA